MYNYIVFPVFFSNKTKIIIYLLVNDPFSEEFCQANVSDNIFKNLFSCYNCSELSEKRPYELHCEHFRSAIKIISVRFAHSRICYIAV